MNKMTLLAITLLAGLALAVLPGCQTEEHHHIEVRPEPVAQPQPPVQRTEIIEEKTTTETLEEKTVIDK